MATPAELVSRTRVRVPMVVSPYAMVLAPVADLRATPDETAELVDQLHYKEVARVLDSRAGWHYLNAADGYFGWIDSALVEVMPGARGGRLVGRALAPIYAEPDTASGVVGHLPAGTKLARAQSAPVEGPWLWVDLRDRRRPEGAPKGYVSLDDATSRDDLPHRPPTAADLIATAECFLGTPYLWGGTSALGIDCSGLVQQVYRLNGVGLPRDADQQARAGRAVAEPRAGDLVFFGSPDVTHVVMSLGGEEIIDASGSEAAVRRRRLADVGLEAVGTRRYLADPA